MKNYRTKILIDCTTNVPSLQTTSLRYKMNLLQGIMIIIIIRAITKIFKGISKT